MPSRSRMRIAASMIAARVSGSRGPAAARRRHAGSGTASVSGAPADGAPSRGSFKATKYRTRTSVDFEIVLDALPTRKHNDVCYWNNVRGRRHGGADDRSTGTPQAFSQDDGPFRSRPDGQAWVGRGATWPQRRREDDIRPCGRDAAAPRRGRPAGGGVRRATRAEGVLLCVWFCGSVFFGG